MFHSSSKQFQQQQPNQFSPMMNNFYYPQQFCHPYALQQQYQQHLQNSMMASMFNNPFSPMSMPNPNPFMGSNNFMGSSRDRKQQQQQFNQMNNFQFPAQSTFNFPSTSSAAAFNPSTFDPTASKPTTTLSTSSNGSTKEETAREIFFRTLSTSLKEANKFFCGKTTTWKNPFLYKTHICENYSNRSFCRFGVNCWYAHGPHELRCIPESDDLPDPVFITQYLSFLGLPSHTLTQIIEYSYNMAKLLTSTETPWLSSSKKSSDFPPLSVNSTRSTSLSPIIDDPLYDDTPATETDEDPIDNASFNKFFTSYASNGGGWDQLQSAINGISGKGEERNACEKPFDKSFNLFADSFNSQKRW